MVNIPLSVYQLRPILTRAASTTSNPWRRRKLNSENRFQKFVALYNFVSPRLGFRPAIKTPQIRNSAWMHLIALATNEEQLRQVTELFPGWNDLRREFGPEVSEAFVRALYVGTLHYVFSPE
jgi:hypothetical protein